MQFIEESLAFMEESLAFMEETLAFQGWSFTFHFTNKIHQQAGIGRSCPPVNYPTEGEGRQPRQQQHGP